MDFILKSDKNSNLMIKNSSLYKLEFTVTIPKKRKRKKKRERERERFRFVE